MGLKKGCLTVETKPERKRNKEKDSAGQAARRMKQKKSVKPLSVEMSIEGHAALKRIHDLQGKGAGM